MEILDMRKILKEDLKESRYEHSIGVSYTAACLAMRDGEDVKKAEIAGLLHDCAKGIDSNELEKLCINAGINLSEEDKKTPQCYHAFYAPVLSKEKYGIEDEYILSSLRWHTTGCKNMSLLDKIIYLADYIEPNRGSATYLSEIRKIAFEDINLAIYTATLQTIQHLKDKNIFIHEKTLECFEWIKQVVKN